MRLPAPCAALLFLPALLTGCGGGDNGDSAAPSPSASSTASATPSASTSATPSPSATSAQPTSNGLAALSAAQILARSKAAAAAAKSVHVSGSVTEQGTATQIDMRYAGATGARGFLTLGGARVDLLRVGQVTYFKADRAFWAKINPQLATLFAGKYVKGGATNPQFAAFRQLTDQRQFFTETLKPDGPLVKGAETTVAGQKVIGLSDNDPKNAGTLYVATQGTPYPVSIRPKSGPGGFSFGEWNRPVPIAAPPAAQVLDIDKLQGK